MNILVKSYNYREEGFTLIELSIVLVILGLIVGAIVGGKSLIDAAKTQKIISELNGYTTAYNAFKLQYDAVPGDFKEGYAYFGNGVWETCGDDTVEPDGNFHSSCNGNGDATMGQQDGIRAWLHLQLAEIIHGKVGSYTGGRYFRPSADASDSLAYTHFNVPATKGGNSTRDGWLFASYLNFTGSETGDWFDKTGNWLQLGASMGNWGMDAAMLTQKKALAIDKKIDDGFPLLGSVTAVTGQDINDSDETADPGCTSGVTNVVNRHSVVVSTAQTYNVGNENISCVLHFYLGN